MLIIGRAAPIACPPTINPLFFGPAGTSCAHQRANSTILPIFYFSESHSSNHPHNIQRRRSRRQKLFQHDRLSHDGCLSRPHVDLCDYTSQVVARTCRWKHAKDGTRAISLPSCLCFSCGPASALLTPPSREIQFGTEFWLFAGMFSGFFILRPRTRVGSAGSRCSRSLWSLACLGPFGAPLSFIAAPALFDNDKLSACLALDARLAFYHCAIYAPNGTYGHVGTRSV